MHIFWIGEQRRSRQQVRWSEVIGRRDEASHRQRKGIRLEHRILEHIGKRLAFARGHFDLRKGEGVNRTREIRICHCRGGLRLHSKWCVQIRRSERQG